jgi:DNA primase large subunit
VTLEGRAFIPEDLDAYRALDPDLFSPIIKELRARDALMKALPRRLPEKLEEGRIRPCILAALEAQLDGGSGHLMRLAIAREFLAAGYSVDEIVPLFKGQADFNPERTRYYVEHAARNPAKPFKCSTIRELGFCLPNCRRSGRGRLARRRMSEAGKVGRGIQLGCVHLNTPQPRARPATSSPGPPASPPPPSRGP